MLISAGVFNIQCGNRFPYGNRSMETLQKEIYDPHEHARYRLYLGNGGATTSYWYSVTISYDAKEEKQLFYSYAYPGVESMAFNKNCLLLNTGSDVIKILKNDFKKYIEKPLAYYRNEKYK
jgi:hypothetical protein